MGGRRSQKLVRGDVTARGVSRSLPRLCESGFAWRTNRRSRPERQDPDAGTALVTGPQSARFRGNPLNATLTRALVHRHEPLQLLEPVLHDDEVRRRAGAGFRLATPDDQEPSIRGDVVGPIAAPETGALRIRTTAADARRRASSRIAPGPQTSADRPGAEEQFPAVPRPEWETAAARRDRLPISELRIPLDVDLASTGHVRGVGDPASVWRDGRAGRCRSRFSPAASRRTGARWRSARSRTECSAAPR